MEAGLLSPQTVYNIHHAIERVNTMRKHKKAYQVDADEQSVIVFEHTNVAARRIGANRMDTEFEYIERCRRAPHFDEYHTIYRLGSIMPKKCRKARHGKY